MDGDALQSVSSDESILTCPVCNKQNLRNKFTCIDIDIFQNLNLGKAFARIIILCTGAKMTQ